MKLVKLTNTSKSDGVTLTLWIVEDEICYLSKEEYKKSSVIISPTEKKEGTVIALKSGRNIFVDESPEQIISQMSGQ